MAEPQGEKGGGIASPGIGQEEKQEAQGDGGQEASPQNAAAPEMDGNPRRRKRSMARNPPQKFGVYMPKVRRGCPRKKYWLFDKSNGWTNITAHRKWLLYRAYSSP